MKNAKERICFIGGGDEDGFILGLDLNCGHNKFFVLFDLLNIIFSKLFDKLTS